MFVHAQDAALGLLVSRQTADGTLRDTLTEATRVIRELDVLPCVHTPKLHLIEVEPGSPLPTLAERTQLTELSRIATSPRWIAVVVPDRQARLVMDIVVLLSPKPPSRRLQAFSSTHSALAWLLTLRPEAHARCMSLLQELDKLALSSRTTARDLRHLRMPPLAVR
jgi:hypothetical protein